CHPRSSRSLLPFTPPPPSSIHSLSLHDALPIFDSISGSRRSCITHSAACPAQKTQPYDTCTSHPFRNARRGLSIFQNTDSTFVAQLRCFFQVCKVTVFAQLLFTEGHLKIYIGVGDVFLIFLIHFESFL